MNTLDQFGELYIKNVRDNTLFLLNEIINGNMKNQKSIEFTLKLSELSNNEIDLMKNLVAYLLDNTLHYTLLLLEENPTLELKFNDENIVSLSDGLCGELYSDDGWISKFSEYPPSL